MGIRGCSLLLLGRKGGSPVQPVIALDIFQTGVIFIRWQQWFMETSQMITGTSRSYHF